MKLKSLIIYLIITLGLNFTTVNAQQTKECAESLSRAFFNFNQTLDKGAILPTAKIYNKLPEPVKTASGNFFRNIGRLLSVPTNLLQGDISAAGDNLGGFMFNIVLGAGGLSDPATELGSKNKKEDFGQVLGFWGVDEGCYFVLPILGPTTIRDGIGMLGDRAIDPFARFTLKSKSFSNGDINGEPADYYGVKIGGVVDFRADNITSFDSLEKNSLDLYSSFKSIYLQDRENKINNKTSDESDWEDFAK